MRTLVRWDPYGEMRSFRRAFDRVFDDFGGVRAVSRPQELGFAVDVSETDASVVVKAALPGINPEDVDISVSEGVLTVKGETKQETSEESESFYRQEIRYGSFSRSVPLPARVDDDKAEATFENGILTVTLPKAEDARPKQIKVTPSAPLRTGGTKTLEASTPNDN